MANKVAIKAKALESAMKQYQVTRAKFEYLCKDPFCDLDDIPKPKAKKVKEVKQVNEVKIDFNALIEHSDQVLKEAQLQTEMREKEYKAAVAMWQKEFGYTQALYL